MADGVLVLLLTMYSATAVATFIGVCVAAMLDTPSKLPRAWVVRR